MDTVFIVAEGKSIHTCSVSFSPEVEKFIAPFATDDIKIARVSCYYCEEPIESWEELFYKEPEETEDHNALPKS